ncbi:nicotinate-nucleotide adenylyltransferase [Robinsoniella peoriensis]
MEQRRKKVGIMGGTFDPIHIGHLILGENAYLQFDLDHVLFMPSGNPPHKQERQGRATTSQRVAMVSQAVSSNPHFKLSMAETHDDGYTYTRETLSRLVLENPDTDYYFIMGADSLFTFETWKEPEDICRLCTLVVAVRDHVKPDKLNRQIDHLKELFQAKIEKLDTPNIDISSGTIREWICRGKSIKYYVPDDVIHYIEEHCMYQECEENE